MGRGAVLATALLLLTSAGCVMRVGSEGGTVSVARVSGLASGYVSVVDLPAYEDTVIRFGIFDMTDRPGEIISLDIWPLAGAGVGILGAWARVLVLEAGGGVLWYQPEPPHRGEVTPAAKVDVGP